MKKLTLLGMMTTMLLSSCSGFDPAGTYQFRLGKTGGSHLEVTAVLTNDAYPNVEGARKMKLSADLGDEMSPSALLEQYGEDLPILMPIISIIEEEIKKMDGIDMYYSLTDYSSEKYGTRLALGTDVIISHLKSLEEQYPVIKELLDLLKLKDEDFIITPERSKYFFNAYINNKTLTFQIPVSMDDAKMQMLWYGKSDRISGEYVSKLPGKQGEERFGTHPSVDKDDAGNITHRDVDDINNMFEVEFSNTDLLDADYIDIGSFVEFNQDGKKNLKLYLDDSYTGPTSHIEAYVLTKGALGEYDLRKEIKLSVDENHITNITHNGKEGKDEGFFDENGTEFTFNYFMQKPFEFRDYHVVNVGLTKI